MLLDEIIDLTLTHTDNSIVRQKSPVISLLDQLDLSFSTNPDDWSFSESVDVIRNDKSNADNFLGGEPHRNSNSPKKQEPPSEEYIDDTMFDYGVFDIKEIDILHLTNASRSDELLRGIDNLDQELNRGKLEEEDNDSSIWAGLKVNDGFMESSIHAQMVQQECFRLVVHRIIVDGNSSSIPASLAYLTHDSSGRLILAECTLHGFDFVVYLRVMGSWVTVGLQPRMVVQAVRSSNDEENKGNFRFLRNNTIMLITVTDRYNYLVLYPEHLIKATTIADSLHCTRYGVIKDSLRGVMATEPMVFGTMIHEIFQKLLVLKDFSLQTVSDLVDKIILLFMKQLYVLGASTDYARDKLMEYMPNLRHFYQTYYEKAATKLNISLEPGNTHCNEHVQDNKIDSKRRKIAIISNQSNNSAHCSNYTNKEPGLVEFYGELTQKSVEISTIFDIEENIWTNKYGIKGKVDCTLEISIDQHNFTSIVPLEIKSGKSYKSNFNHQAQLILYTLMLSDSYQMDINKGLLYYCKTGDVYGTNAGRPQLIALIMARNAIAVNQISDHKLPPTCKLEKLCERCYINKACARIHNSVESGTAITSGFNTNLYDRLIKELDEDYNSFFKEWYELVSEEGQFIHQDKIDLQKMTISERARDLKCIRNLRIVEMEIISSSLSTLEVLLPKSTENDVTLSQKIGIGGFNPYKRYKLINSNFMLNQTNELNFLECNLTVGETILLGCASDASLLGGAKITMIRETEIIISADRNLKMTATRKNMMLDNMEIYIQKNEFESAIDQMKSNLVTFFSDDSPHAASLRSLIFKRTAPRFSRHTIIDGDDNNLDVSFTVSTQPQSYFHSSILDSDPTYGDILEELDKNEDIKASANPIYNNNNLNISIVKNPNTARSVNEMDGDTNLCYSQCVDTQTHLLNENQLKALNKCLKCKDYALVLGMPGTGKTTLICSFIEKAYQSKKSVLIVCFTNSAVDNILLKLKDMDVPFLRLGNKPKVHPQIVPYCEDEVIKARKIASVEALGLMYDDIIVYACTVYSINDVIFSKKTDFDYCILDEASQLTLPLAIGPLLLAKKFILVGDHNQLGPLVKNPVIAGKLSNSLFRILCEAHPSSVVSLTQQYRMNKDIMMLSNSLVYNNQMTCGTIEIANAVLNLDNARDNHPSMTIIKDYPWLSRIIAPSSTVIFLNTDRLMPTESPTGKGFFNKDEAVVVQIIINTFLELGVSGYSIGIISPYLTQVGYIRDLLKTSKGENSVEVSTVDTFQGRDKDVVIISMVRSNTAQNSGTLLKDMRRLNVAYSRAKKKLILIGSRSTLQENLLLIHLFDLCDKNNWCVDL